MINLVSLPLSPEQEMCESPTSDKQIPSMSACSSTRKRKSNSVAQLVQELEGHAQKKSRKGVVVKKVMLALYWNVMSFSYTVVASAVISAFPMYLGHLLASIAAGLYVGPSTAKVVGPPQQDDNATTAELGW